MPNDKSSEPKIKKDAPKKPEVTLTKQDYEVLIQVLQRADIKGSDAPVIAILGNKLNTLHSQA